MMGHNHAAAGLTLGVVTAPWVGVQAPTVFAAWMVAVAGFALLSDVDTTHSSASRMWGPLSQLLFRPVVALAGGHRWGTHDAILAPVGFAVLAWLSARTHVSSLVMLTIAIGLALRGLTVCGLGRVGAPLNLILSSCGAWWLTQHAWADWANLLPAAVAIGVLTHIAGDALTTHGIPIPVVWLRKRVRVGLPLLATGGLLEAVVVSPILASLFVWSLWTSKAAGDVPVLIGDLIRHLQHRGPGLSA